MPDPVLTESGFNPTLTDFKVVPIDEKTVHLITVVGPSSGVGAFNWLGVITKLIAAAPQIVALIQTLFSNPTPTPPPAPKEETP